VDYKRHKADITELELAELKGNMHAANDVFDVTCDLILAIRSRLLALPGQLAVDVAEVKTAAETSKVIALAVNDILEELAGYQYDPEEYSKRVRERQGWNMGDEQNQSE